MTQLIQLALEQYLSKFNLKITDFYSFVNINNMCLLKLDKILIKTTLNHLILNYNSDDYLQCCKLLKISLNPEAFYNLDRQKNYYNFFNNLTPNILNLALYCWLSNNLLLLKQCLQQFINAQEHRLVELQIANQTLLTPYNSVFKNLLMQNLHIKHNQIIQITHNKNLLRGFNLKYKGKLYQFSLQYKINKFVSDLIQNVYNNTPFDTFFFNN